jgi:hypothetical protein
MPEFYPPKLNPWLVRSIQLVAPWVAHLTYRVDLEVDAESLKRLSGLRQQRVLLLPNHPTFHDPIVLFLLSGQMGQFYYYLAAYEQFRGPLGAFLQSVGVYSIRRGGADRSSIAQTLDLLSRPQCHLVIFPEGGCSFQNDTVMPFRAGAVQLAFQAMNRFAKQGQPIPDFYLLPISIKYHYRQDMTRVIDRTLSGLEQALEISPANQPYDRLRAIAAQVLSRAEREYGITPAGGASWNNRIASLKAQALRTSEQALGLTPLPSDPDRERVYRIQNALQSRTDFLEASDDSSPALERTEVAAMQQAMLRLLNFDAIYDGYVAANPTPERFLDTLIRFEREVFGIDQPPPKGYRKAALRVGTPANLKDHFADYQTKRVSTVETLNTQIQQTVQANLDLLNQS